VIHRIALAALVLACSLPATRPAHAQQIPIPEGYTAYRLEGPGIGAPPLPFKIEGERLSAPPELAMFLAVTESQVTADRVTASLQTPQGPARLVAVREGDVFAGFLLGVEPDGDRFGVPVTFTPVDQETTMRPDLAAFGSAPGVSRIEIVPGDVAIKAGEPQRFVARVFDESGQEIAEPGVEWYAGGGTISAAGEFRSERAGEAMVFAVVQGAIGGTGVTVSGPDVARLKITTEVPERLAAGSRIWFDADALSSVHRWDLDPDITITSSEPEIVEVLADHSIVARRPGRATVTVTAEPVSESYAIEVVPASGALSITGIPAEPIKTGDVVALATSIADARPAWSVVQAGAAVWPASDFVAEKPGTYTVMATLGDKLASATIRVVARETRGRFHVVGRGLNPGMFTADIWPQNGYVYLGTHQADQIRTYDVRDPANPVLTDSLTVDARVINSVKVSRNGKWLAATREGAANRRNGIVLYSLEDPAHPRQVSEYTETVTSGVHNVFWATDSILYLTNDGTGDMNILDVSDPSQPREIGRWGLPVSSKTLHDIWAQDGVLWVSYMRDGLVILDIGGGGKGGTPANPVEMSRLFYPDGPTHNAFRYGDYLFVGDEDFSSMQGTKPSLPAGLSADPRGEVHVIDVSDLSNPRYAARYEVPEAGAHNLWVQDGVMVVGFYQGGVRAVDVSGTLRGDLYRQGREIAHFLPQGLPEDAKIPYAPMVWGIFPMFENGWKPTGDVWFVTDYNSGLWTMKLEIERPERPIS
jgi:hypothetical protein